MGFYRKKPVVIEAMQWDGTAAGATPIIDWALDGGGTIRYHDEAPTHLAVDTAEGTMSAIKGVKDEFYPCKPDIFDVTYERAWAPVP